METASPDGARQRIAMSKKRLAISMGDAAGVGPELCCRISAEPEFSEHELIIYGNREILQRVATQCQLPLPQHINDFTVPDVAQIQAGQIQARCGALASACFEQAIQDALAGQVDAIVTCPVHKQALALSAAPFNGHTEWLQDRCAVEQSYMLMYDERISVALATCHQSLASVPSSINTAQLVQLGRMLHDFFVGLGMQQPRLAMCGLNPHAGEGGLFGNEETVITAAVDALRAEQIQISDVLPPDTAFTPFMRERFDAYICMYHDQGLIPFKSIAFDRGVNVTLGLPIIRSSVDHGTAFDIAWQGTAQVSSLASACRVALRLAENRMHRV